MGAQDSESTSLTDEDVCHELEGATSSQEGSATSGTKGIDFSRTSLESSASLEGLSKQFCHTAFDFFPLRFNFVKDMHGSQVKPMENHSTFREV